jgi:hypothetical protein
MDPTTQGFVRAPWGSAGLASVLRLKSMIQRTPLAAKLERQEQQSQPQVVGKRLGVLKTPRWRILLYEHLESPKTWIPP